MPTQCPAERQALANKDEVGVVIPGITPQALGLELDLSALPTAIWFSDGDMQLYFDTPGHKDTHGTVYAGKGVLGSGAMGTVSLYTRHEPHPNTPAELAIKMFVTLDPDTNTYVEEAYRPQVLEEIAFVKMRRCAVRGRALRTTMVPAVHRKNEASDGSDAVIMHRAVGLDRAITNDAIFPEADALRMYAEVAIAMYANQLKLLEAGLCYTDVKDENLALLPVSDSDVALVFIDYGGLCDIRNGESCTATYPPPPRFDGIFDPGSRRTAVELIMYSAAMLFISLPLQRASHAGDESARKIFKQANTVLSHNSTAPRADKEAMLLRLAEITRLTVPGPEGRALASWFSWDPADRKTVSEILEESHSEPI